MALEIDPVLLLRLALEQAVAVTAAKAIIETFGNPVTAHEALWLAELRDASVNRDPRPTTRTRRAFRAIFVK